MLQKMLHMSVFKVTVYTLIMFDIYMSCDLFGQDIPEVGRPWYDSVGAV